MNIQTSIDEFARLSDGSTLVLRRWLPGPAERIWRYLTDSELRAKWLAAGDMTLAPGSALELVWRNDDLSAATDPRPAGFAEEQRMDSRVIAVDPPRRLTIAWGKGDVTFDLEPKGNRVLFTVTHSGLGDASARTMIAAGWHVHSDILASELSGAVAPSFWPTWSKLQGTYAARFGD